jgi:hypothetical protein
MDRTAMARKLREALFDHIETECRDALQDSAIDSLFEKVLASCESTPVDWSVPAAISDDAPWDYLSRVRKPTDEEMVWARQEVERLGLEAHPSADPCQRKPDTTGCGICWGKTASPAIGDVNLESMSVYAHKDGTAQWVSIHDPVFSAVMAAARS